MKHETHLPAEQTQAQTEIRIPRPDEDRRRPQGDPTSSPSRKKSPYGLTKTDKLRKRYEFQSVMKQGDRLVGKFLCIDRRKGARLRLGITASGRFGNSPERNRFKRLVREAFRTARSHLPPDLELNILPRQKAKGAKMGEIQDELIRLLKC